MPKKIKRPNATLTLRWEPTALRIQHTAEGWFIRARQTTPLGNTWIVIACVDDEREALSIADDLTAFTNFKTNGTKIERTHVV